MAAPNDHTVLTVNAILRITAYLFVAPWIIGFLVFTGGPIIFSFVLSFFRWKVINTPRFIGFDHFVAMFTTDDLFIPSA